MVNDDRSNPEFQGFSIVALGSFNPAIFQPFWLAANGIIRNQEAQDADLEVTDSEFSSFGIDWFLLQVIKFKFIAATLDPGKTMELRDLVANIFSILEHTPITGFGFNANLHFNMDRPEEVGQIFERFSPSSAWSGILELPTPNSLVYKGFLTHERYPSVTIKLEPSGRVTNGLFVSVNQHYELEETNNLYEKMRAFYAALKFDWEVFQSRVRTVYLDILSVQRAEAKEIDNGN